MKELLANPNFRLGLIIIGLLIIGIVGSRLVRWIMDKSFKAVSESHPVDSTRYKFFKNAVSFIIWLIISGAIISLIPQLRTLAITLFAGAGIFVAIIGFAAQAAFSNIISGIFIVIFKPIRVGDLIRVGEIHQGIVEDITLRHTVLLNFENKRIIIPNATVSAETIINDHIGDSHICRWIEVGISYDSDLKKAIRLVREVCEAHPLCLDPREFKNIDSDNYKVEVRVIKFNDSSVDLRAYVWTDQPLNAIRMHSEINIGIKDAFDTNGIEIPFPHRTLVYKNAKQNEKKE